jgi:fatty-acyl-CoA synthase
VLKGGTAVCEQDLVAHVKQRIARYKAPREVVLIDALPKTSTGKIRKMALREQAWAEKTARIQG